MAGTGRPRVGPYCLLCGWQVEADDLIVTPRADGGGLCVHCYRKETGDLKTMPAALRRELTEVMWNA